VYNGLRVGRGRTMYIIALHGAGGLMSVEHK
jgi:hypothetical protein